ncbi:hypothetical protein L602_002900000030 [Cupriavidus gilardii J11]|uniref:Uncharacterized protein n=1 Tax=Cupriavidus gilardii J11 TaxID=936133 RepID=A0A562BFV2_9BURK|nr:hypothetical protein L602_002900000030 [Cupriavidus gilardii J11]
MPSPRPAPLPRPVSTLPVPAGMRHADRRAGTTLACSLLLAVSLVGGVPAAGSTPSDPGAEEIPERGRHGAPLGLGQPSNPLPLARALGGAAMAALPWAIPVPATGSRPAGSLAPAVTPPPAPTLSRLCGAIFPVGALRQLARTPSAALPGPVGPLHAAPALTRRHAAPRPGAAPVVGPFSGRSAAPARAPSLRCATWRWRATARCSGDGRRRHTAPPRRSACGGPSTMPSR